MEETQLEQYIKYVGTTYLLNKKEIDRNLFLYCFKYLFLISNWDLSQNSTLHLGSKDGASRWNF